MDPKNFKVPPKGVKLSMRNSHGIDMEATYEQVVAMHTPPAEQPVETPFAPNVRPEDFKVVDTTREQFAREVSRERFIQ